MQDPGDVWIPDAEERAAFRVLTAISVALVAIGLANSGLHWIGDSLGLVAFATGIFLLFGAAFARTNRRPWW